MFHDKAAHLIERRVEIPLVVGAVIVALYVVFYHLKF
jgi:hypothetical protein